jgi:chorismate mutase
MSVRAVRGAITIEENKSREINDAVRQLLGLMINENNIDSKEIVSIFFTVTNDINATFPAAAARDMGLIDVPLLCSNEIDVPGGLKSCIRILLQFNTDKGNHEIRHIYLKEAQKLRPDLS